MSTITSARPAHSRMRWVICALLFFATVIAYIDRQALAIIEKDLEKILGFGAQEYGWITGGFQWGYAIGMVVAGWLTDKLGTRLGFAVAITLWSFAAMTPGAASSATTLGIAMFLLGLGEAANFPACIKTVAEWFPKSERALAVGIFNSGANVGNMVVPIIIPMLVAGVGWRGAFVVAGSSGFLWLGFWLKYYRKPEKHPKVSEEELTLILSEPLEKIKSVPWKHVFPRKETWAFALAKFLTDPVWWFYGFWLPRYIQGTFNLTADEAKFPVALAFALSFIGSVGGGWLSSAFLKRGMSVNASRKIAMLICALCVVPVMAAPFIGNMWGVVFLVGLAAAAHQGWSANLFTLVSDMFPRIAVASVVGIGGMIGAIGGAITQPGVGYVVAKTGTYTSLFLIVGTAYLFALLIIHLLSPKLEVAKFEGV
jgi:ACS family hexuronate transporter-like MFS transporter